MGRWCLKQALNRKEQTRSRRRKTHAAQPEIHPYSGQCNRISLTVILLTVGVQLSCGSSTYYFEMMPQNCCHSMAHRMTIQKEELVQKSPQLNLCSWVMRHLPHIHCIGGVVLTIQPITNRQWTVTLRDATTAFSDPGGQGSMLNAAEGDFTKWDCIYQVTNDTRQPI